MQDSYYFIFIIIGAETPILWPSAANSRLIEKTLMLGKIEGKRRREATEDETVEWHHWLNGHEFEQTLQDSEGQRSLACCSPWESQWDGHNLAIEQQWQMSTCHLLLQGLSHVLLQLLTFNNPWREFRVESRNEALCLWGKNWKDRSSDRYFQELILWA